MQSLGYAKMALDSDMTISPYEVMLYEVNHRIVSQYNGESRFCSTGYRSA